MKFTFPLTLLLAFSVHFAFGQFEYLPLSNEYEQKYNYSLYKKEVDIHSSVRPFRRSEVERVMNIDSANRDVFYRGRFMETWFGGALFNKHFVEIRKEDFDLSLDPLVNFNAGTEREGSASYTYTNTRGIYVEGRIGSQVTFMTSFTENQSRFADYLNSYINEWGVVPGQGQGRPFKTDAFDYSNAFGIVSYTPSKFFNFTLGQGKHFFGEGYRSMFLSDAAFNYPFFKIETTVWRIKYVNLWTEQRDIRKSVEVNQQFRKKWSSMHYLSYNVNSRLNISLFEAVVYRSDTNNRGLEASYFNPIILYRPIEFANGSDAANVMVGIGMSYKLFNDVQLYGQFALDEFVKGEIITEPGSWRNKYSGQLGVKYFNAFGVQRLNLLGEFNAVRPYMYSHDDILSNHAHYNQAAAHLWGGNFMEMVLRGDFTHRRWVVQGMINVGFAGNDTAASNWGRNVYLSYDDRQMDDGNKIGQGVNTSFFMINGQVAYVVNPSYNMRVEAGGTFRREVPEVNTPELSSNTTLYVYFGLRTALFNHYYDL